MPVDTFNLKPTTRVSIFEMSFQRNDDVFKIADKLNDCFECYLTGPIPFQSPYTYLIILPDKKPWGPLKNQIYAALSDLIES